MALASTQVLDRAWSIGPYRIEVHTFTAANGDTSGTATAKSLHEVDQVIVTGLLNVTATYSGAVATLAFADPGVAGTAGQIIFIGK